MTVSAVEWAGFASVPDASVEAESPEDEFAVTAGSAWLPAFSCGVPESCVSDWRAGEGKGDAFPDC
jgi:hypothetical protein